MKWILYFLQCFLEIRNNFYKSLSNVPVYQIRFIYHESYVQIHEKFPL